MGARINGPRAYPRMYIDTMNAAMVSLDDLKSFMIRGIAGATIEEANGVRKVTVETTAIFDHFFLDDQFTALAVSSGESQSITFGSWLEVSCLAALVSASSVVSTIGMPCSTSGSIGADFSPEEDRPLSVLDLKLVPERRCSWTAFSSAKVV